MKKPASELPVEFLDAAVELLVMECSERPWPGMSLVEVVREVDPVLPIIFVARFDPELRREARRLAVAAYRALEGEGLGRVDFLLDRASGTFFVSEVNSLPGFTEASMFPKLWQASGLAYPALLDRLIELAVERHRRRAALDLAGNLVFTAIAGLLTWRALVGAGEMLRYGETTMVLAVPIWWGFMPAVFCLGVLTLVCGYTAGRSLREMTTGRPHDGGGGATGA